MTIVVALLAVLASFVPGEALELTRGASEPWRFVTGHLTHWNAQHLLWDVVAFFALGLACERRNRAAFAATLIAGIVLIPFAVWTFAPEVAAYRGLSGLASATFVLLLLQERNRWSMLFGALFVAKIGFEFATGTTLFTSDLGGAVPVPVAHVAGALAAVMVMLPRRALLLAPLALAACSIPCATPAVAPNRYCPELAGVWSDFRTTQLGPARVRLSLGEDCRYRLGARLMFGSVCTAGTYAIDGNRLRLWPDGEEADGKEMVWPFERRFDRLVLHEPDGAYTYTHAPCASSSPC